MIAILEGAPGNGKSFTATMNALEALDQGRYVVTNIEFVPGWEKTAANANVFRWLIPGRRAATAASYRRRFMATGDLEELMRVRLPNCGRCSHCRRGGTCRREGRGLLILDECHNWMNARSWKAGDRERIVRWLSQHRKLGFDALLIAQSAEMIDKQVRDLAEVRVTLRNLRRWRPWGIPVCPFNVFIAHWRWEAGNRDLMRTQQYRLRRKIAALYDTMATSHGLDDDLTGPPITPPFDRRVAA